MEAFNAIRATEKSCLLALCKQYKPFKMFPANLQKAVVIKIEAGMFEEAVSITENAHTSVASSEQYITSYSILGYNLKINIDIGSPVNVGKPEHVGTYVMKRICNSAKLMYLRSMKHISSDMVRLMESTVPHYNLKDLAKLSSIELNPLINQTHTDELALRSKQTIKIRTSKYFTCYKCGKKETTVVEKQVRRADEGATLFITCINCGNEWKSSG